MKKYRKKPVIIEAIQFNGKNGEEIIKWINDQSNRNAGLSSNKDYILIRTLEGTHRANIGDYIIKGIKGEFYPCKSDIFNETYEEI